MSSRAVTIAVEGCCHGELDKIYTTIAEAEQKSGKKVDLLLGASIFCTIKLIFIATHSPTHSHSHSLSLSHANTLSFTHIPQFAATFNV